MNGKTKRFLSVGTALGLLASAGSAAFLGSRLIQPAKAAAPYDFASDTLTFSQQGLSNGVQYDKPFTNGSVSVSFAGGGNDGKYYTTGSGIRTYGSGSVNVSVVNQNYVLKQVVFTWSDSGYAPTDGNVASVGTYSTNTSTWTGSAGSFSLSRPSGTGHWRLQALTFTVESLSSYSVRYDGNGGTGSVKDDNEYQSGDQVTVKDNAFTRGNFVSFTQWNTKADGSGTAYNPGAKFNITGSLTLYAIWAFDEVELGDGSYTATLPYANPIPTSVNVESNSVAKAALEVTCNGVGYDDFYKEYVLNQSTGNIIFTNHTNAKFTKIVINTYQYDNYDVYADNEIIHSGDKEGGYSAIEIEANNAETTIRIQNKSAEHSAKLFSVELFMRVGNEEVHPTGVELNATSGDIFIGKSRQLTASVLPLDADDRTVTWSTSDPKIATVDENGLVTGVAAGNVTITATTKDGGLEASFAGTVKNISYGTLEEPLTVEQAREVLATENPTTQALFVKGRVTNSTYYSGKSSSYTIWLESSDGTIPHYFELYHTRLRPAFGVDTFTAGDALAGMTVVASGLAKMYGETPELADFDTNYPYVEAIEMSAEQFADAMIADTQSICDGYATEESSAHRSSLNIAWGNLSIKYGCVTEEGKNALINATANQSGTIIEKAVARYDFLAAKYQFDAFIVGRSPISLAQNVYSPVSGGNATWAIALVAGVSVGALAVGAFVALRKKKPN